MSKLRNATLLLLAAATVAAGLEWDSAIVLGLFTCAVTALLIGLSLESGHQDGQYLMAVEMYRRPTDPPLIVAPIHSVAASLGGGLWFIGMLLGIGSVAVLMNSPLPVLGAAFLWLARFVIQAVRLRYHGRPDWRAFAEANAGLVHDGGDLLDRWCPEKIEGSYRQRTIHLSPVTRITSNRPVRFAVTAKLQSPRETFCWESTQLEAAMTLQAGRWSRATDLGRRLAAISPVRLTVSKTQLCLYTPRLPRTAAELRFFCELVCDLSQSLED